MKIDDLDLRELLEVSPTGGVLRFAGQRALIMDATALGLLRHELIETVGITAARGVLTRFGYAHGWRTAESLKTAFPWDSERDWRTAGARLHTLQGLVRAEVPAPAPRVDGAPEPPFAESLWHSSYEAEQHLLTFGQATDPVCWTLTGFASGYLSHASGREILCIETQCAGRGDPFCRMIGRSREEWGHEIDEHLPFYEKGCLDAALVAVTDQLHAAERKLRQKRQELSRATGEDAVDASGGVARSEPMRRLHDLARRVAQVDSTVLITGESGAGKERIAHLIHEQSARAGAPFLAINCGAVTETLLESELFGHARGAFTGATQDRPGLFEAANGGTLLLDEVGEVPPAMQVKLLRALQEREVRRVGENKNRAIDVRLLAATNRDLAKEVAAGRFRQDLYYRLRVVELRVPALRERKEDLLPLARVLLADALRRLGKKGITGFAPEAAERLLHHDWPGNVRELENAIERAVALASGTRLLLEDFPEEVRAALPTSLTPGAVRTLDEVEKDYILAVLAVNDGNQARTADQLQIGTATLYRKLKKYKGN